MGLLDFHRDRDALLKCHFTLVAKKLAEKAYPVSLATLGDHIRKKRLDVKLLQKDVAGVLGVHTTTIYHWERNRCQPRLYLFPKIAKFLGYSPFPTDGEPSHSEAIKAYRLMHGLSQKKMAKQLGIDPTTLANWEIRKTKPSRKLTDRVWRLLGEKPL
jgi:DNA-binding XRE family transcriptional regulator